MNWDGDAVKAAQAAIRRVNEQIDLIGLCAAQIESLMCVLAHAEEAPREHRAGVCYVAADLAQSVAKAAALLSQMA